MGYVSRRAFCGPVLHDVAKPKTGKRLTNKTKIKKEKVPKRFFKGENKFFLWSPFLRRK